MRIQSRALIRFSVQVSSLGHFAARARWLAGLLVSAFSVATALAGPDPAVAPGAATHADHGRMSDRSAMSSLVSTLSAGTRPVVIMFSTPGCPYCRALRTEHLDALERAQERVGVLYLELDLADRRPFAIDPGVRLPPVLDGLDNGRDLARRLSVRLAPTVIFLGPEGELAERLVGYGARDFYAAYLDQRIADARRRLRAP